MIGGVMVAKFMAKRVFGFAVKKIIGTVLATVIVGLIIAAGSRFTSAVANEKILTANLEDAEAQVTFWQAEHKKMKTEAIRVTRLLIKTENEVQDAWRDVDHFTSELKKAKAREKDCEIFLDGPLPGCMLRELCNNGRLEGDACSPYLSNPVDSGVLPTGSDGSAGAKPRWKD